MTHLSLELLLQLRERGAEPGTADARRHLDGCPRCQAEARRLDQRAARLKALSSLRPARDQWPMLRARVVAEQRRRRLRWTAVVGLAAAAVVTVVITLRRPVQEAPEQLAISAAMERSSQLEQLIQSYNPDARVTDGRTVRVASELENQIAVLDRNLEVAQMLDPRQRDEALLRLWRQRVGLLDALVDVHLTRASAVGF